MGRDTREGREREGGRRGWDGMGREGRGRVETRMTNNYNTIGVGSHYCAH